MSIYLPHVCDVSQPSHPPPKIRLRKQIVKILNLQSSQQIQRAAPCFNMVLLFAYSCSHANRQRLPFISFLLLLHSLNHLLVLAYTMVIRTQT